MKNEFQEEKDRVTMLRELLQLSQTEFSRRIGISQGALSQIESGRSRLSMETLKNLSTEFNINCNWLVNGKGDIFYNNTRSNGLKSTDNFIPLVNKNAKAGYFRGSTANEYLKTLDVYKIPGFEGGDYRMFEIEGDSMIPTLHPGEIVIAKRVLYYEKLENRALYIILHFKDLKAKRILKTEDKNVLMLISDNPEYTPHSLKLKEIKEMWVVQGKVSRNFLSETVFYPDKIKNLEDQLLLLQSKVDKLLS